VMYAAVRGASVRGRVRSSDSTSFSGVRKFSYNVSRAPSVAALRAPGAPRLFLRLGARRVVN